MQHTQAFTPHNRTLGARVQALRQASPLQKEAIAAGVGVSLNTLWHIESGRGCRSDTLAQLGQFFGVSVDYLLGLTEARTPGQAGPPSGQAETPSGRPSRRRPQAALVPG